MKSFIISIILALTPFTASVYAADEDHGEHKEEEHQNDHEEESHDESNHADHEGEEHSEDSENTSSGKIKKEEDIVLSEAAIKNFAIKTMKFNLNQNEIELPISALVTSKDKTQIFFKHDGKFEIVDVKIKSKNGKTFFIENISFPINAEIVFSGVNFLKVVELSHGEDGSQGHSH